MTTMTTIMTTTMVPTPVRELDGIMGLRFMRAHFAEMRLMTSSIRRKAVSTDGPTDRPTHRPTDRLTGRPTDRPTERRSKSEDRRSDGLITKIDVNEEIGWESTMVQNSHESRGPLACLLAHSLIRLTHSLAMNCILRLRAPGKVTNLMSHND